MNKLSMILTAALTLCAATSAEAATVFDTTSSSTATWQPFGRPNTSTYGQTFTAPTDNVLNSFSLFLTPTGAVDFKAFLYLWDGTKATGTSLFSSDILNSNNGPEFMFNTGGISLLSGAQYVAFLTTAGVPGGNGTTTMPTDGYQDTLPGGSFVYYNAGNDFAALTSSSWDKTGGGDDVFFKASFSSAVAAVPEPGTWAMMLVGFAFIGGAMRSAKRRQKLTVAFA